MRLNIEKSFDLMATVEVEVKHADGAPEENCSAKPTKQGEGLCQYYSLHIYELQLLHRQKTHNLNRLKAQRNELNSRGRMLREELQLLQEPGSYVGEVVKVMGKNKVLVKISLFITFFNGWFLLTPQAPLPHPLQLDRFLWMGSSSVSCCEDIEGIRS